MPLILLFGDHHFSYDNMCDANDNSSRRATTSDSARRKKEVEIYSPGFLKQLDKLSTPSRPIDFYVEYFDDTDNGSFNSPLDKFTEPLFQPCYKRTIKRGSQCPAPNIRWHYSDIRLSKMKNNIEYIFDTLYMFTQFCNDVVERGSYEGVSLESWKQISDAIHKRNMRFSNTLVKQLIRERRDLNTPYKILDFYKKQTGIDVAKKRQLREIIEVLRSENLAEEIVELIFEYTNATANQSLIYKQFMKQDRRRIFADKEFIIASVKESLRDKLSGARFPDNGAFANLDKFEIEGSDYKDINNLLLHVNSTLVDIYTVLRMMKKIDRPPALCIGYFGNMHVLNLVNILMRTGYYVVDQSVEENRENRCLPFEINLRKDLVSASSSSQRTTRRRSSRTKSKMLSSQNIY
jgi:hypothetical protein